MNTRFQIYNTSDFALFMGAISNGSVYRNYTLEELLNRDEQREKDGFKPKIKMRSITKPSKNGSSKNVIVPRVIEEKFYHDSRKHIDEENMENEESIDGDDMAGTGEGEEGEILGKIPLTEDDFQQGEDEGQGAGSGEGADHKSSENMYEIGRVLSEKFKLPNLENKGKRKSLIKYNYDLTDRNKGSGQVLDKRETLKQIIKTNIGLNIINEKEKVDPLKFLINPRDYVYRTLNRQKDYESQAVVFFIRDYSGSMYGKPTEITQTIHSLIYSWLMYQYKERVETRFILHDTEAEEVTDFKTYYSKIVAGGTQIYPAFKLMNDIVDREGLEQDNNIFCFYSGDGDDWTGTPNLPLKAEFDKMFRYINRCGITLVKNSWSDNTNFQKFIEAKIASNKSYYKQFHWSKIEGNATDDKIIQHIKYLLEE